MRNFQWAILSPSFSLHSTYCSFNRTLWLIQNLWCEFRHLLLTKNLLEECCTMFHKHTTLLKQKHTTTRTQPHTTLKQNTTLTQQIANTHTHLLTEYTQATVGAKKWRTHSLFYSLTLFLSSAQCNIIHTHTHQTHTAHSQQNTHYNPNRPDWYIFVLLGIQRLVSLCH